MGLGVPGPAPLQKEGQLLLAACMRGAVPRPRGTSDAALPCGPEPLLCAAGDQKGLFLSERQL